MPEQSLSDQKVRYNGRTYHNVQVTHIKKDSDNKGIDRQYGDNLTYGCVSLPGESNQFVVIQRNNYWLAIDTI